jgi:SAM-dependent methyltransferase
MPVMRDEAPAGYYDAWAEAVHAREFDRLALSPAFILKKHFESFNEVRLLKQASPAIRGTRFFEIGCATGEFYRYLRRNLPKFEYRGFDISAPAIVRARTKFESDRFVTITSISEMKARVGTASVVFCRDVVHHQMQPLECIGELIDLSEECLVMRLRTRDVGATVLDPERSCQRHYDNYWVPYMVLNITELVDRLSSHPRVRSIIISRHYEVLGGLVSRYLPKDLYEVETGGAATAVLVRTGLDRREGNEAPVQFDDRPDGPAFALWERAVNRLARRLWTLRSPRPWADVTALTGSITGGRDDRER